MKGVLASVGLSGVTAPVDAGHRQHQAQEMEVRIATGVPGGEGVENFAQCLGVVDLPTGDRGTGCDFRQVGQDLLRNDLPAIP
ncbi:hypothetical protein [Embleya sp. NPDC059237]|uniref:hypothetical protein n=1 Tax=Embleya sp. NPDC059237 TaxID=3346784 RepID=UPI003694A5F0